MFTTQLHVRLCHLTEAPAQHKSSLIVVLYLSFTIIETEGHQDAKNFSNPLANKVLVLSTVLRSFEFKTRILLFFSRFFLKELCCDEIK